MKADYLIISRSSSIDRETGALSLFDIIDEVTVFQYDNEEFKGPILQMVIASGLKREEGEAGVLNKTFNLQIVRPDGESTQMDQNLNVQFKEEHLHFRMRINLDIKFTMPGLFTFNLIDEDGIIFATNDLMVKTLQSD